MNDNENIKGSTTKHFGEAPVSHRIEELNKSLGSAQTAFSHAEKNLYWQIAIWAVLCIACIVIAIVFFCELLHKKFEEQYWTWQYVYYTAIRLTAISGLFYVASFTFNMFKSVINLYQENKRKQTIIASMASFVESGSDPANRTLILNKLIEIVVDWKTIANDKKAEAQLTLPSNFLDKLLETLKKS